MERIASNLNPGRPAPVDLDPSRRPGVPMLTRNVAPYPAVAGRPIEQQKPEHEILMGVEAKINAGADLTPAFGDTIPPRGLSGIIRRAGYKYPEHHAARWMIVLLGDRVDVWESRVRRHPFRTLAVLAFVGVLLRKRDD